MENWETHQQAAEEEADQERILIRDKTQEPKIFSRPQKEMVAQLTLFAASRKFTRSSSSSHIQIPPSILRQLDHWSKACMIILSTSTSFNSLSWLMRMDNSSPVQHLRVGQTLILSTARCRIILVKWDKFLKKSKMEFLLMMFKKIMRVVRSKTRAKLLKEETQRKKREWMVMAINLLLDHLKCLANPLKRLSNNHMPWEQMVRTDKLFLRACQVKWELVFTRKAWWLQYKDPRYLTYPHQQIQPSGKEITIA